MLKEELRVIYEYESIQENSDLWIAICCFLKEKKIISKKYKIDDKRKTINEVEKLLIQGEPFIVEDDLFSFYFGTHGRRKFQQLIINEVKIDEINWDDWIKKLSEQGKFVYAWKYNDDYSYWQNERQIDSYKMFNKSYSHLPLKASGEPLPLPQIVIDTSKNPGRNIFRQGYVEAVGSSMWLGDEFFVLTGADKEKVMKVDWLEVEEIKPGIIKIKAQEECFTEFEGREAELQNKMRDLLYPNHENDSEV